MSRCESPALALPAVSCHRTSSNEQLEAAALASQRSNADEREALREELRSAMAAERAAMATEMQRVVDEAIRADRCASARELQTRLDGMTASLLATVSNHVLTTAKAEVEAAVALVAAQTREQLEAAARATQEAIRRFGDDVLANHMRPTLQPPEAMESVLEAALAEVSQHAAEAHAAAALAEQAAAKVGTVLEELSQRQSEAEAAARAPGLPSPLAVQRSLVGEEEKLLRLSPE